jgi:hypothetical protein
MAQQLTGLGIDLATPVCHRVGMDDAGLFPDTRF